MPNTPASTSKITITTGTTVFLRALLHGFASSDVGLISAPSQYSSPASRLRRRPLLQEKAVHGAVNHLADQFFRSHPRKVGPGDQQRRYSVNRSPNGKSARCRFSLMWFLWTAYA